MANPTQFHSGNTRKYILIGVLGLILITVVVVQFSGSGGSPAPSDEARKPSRAPRRPRGRGGKPAVVVSKPPAVFIEKDWPELDRNEILGHDPFALPKQLRPVESTQATTQVAINSTDPQTGLLPDRPLDVSGLQFDGVVLGDGIAVASFGGEKFVEGEVVQGFRIKKIHPDRVELEEARKQP